MLDNIRNMLAYFGENYNHILVCVVIMVSAIIVGIGLLKPILFDKIKNKNVRKAVLALSNVAACFLTVMVYFFVRGWAFTYYVYAAVALSVSCIITYWLYENTCLRNLIKVIGDLVLRKVLKVVLFSVTAEDINAVKTEVKKVSNELKGTTLEEIRKTAAKIKEDSDLEGL